MKMRRRILQQRHRTINTLDEAINPWLTGPSIIHLQTTPCGNMSIGCFC